MSHPSERRWAETAGRVSTACDTLLRAILNAEEQYQELLVDYQWAGGTDTGFASVLFETDTPTTEQIAMVADLRNAMVAAHQLHEAMANGVVSQADRATSLRTMT